MDSDLTLKNAGYFESFLTTFKVSNIFGGSTTKICCRIGDSLTQLCLSFELCLKTLPISNNQHGHECVLFQWNKNLS